MNLPAPNAPRLHRGAWLASLGLVVLLLLFVAFVGLVAPALPVLPPPLLLVLGLLVALVPGLIWLGFFYLQDRLEPEPKVYVLEVFLLGALLALAIGVPLVRNVFHLSQWLYTNTWTHLLGSVLIAGFTQEFLIYAAVRYSVYSSAEFDERVDGIIYTVAAGLGFATLLNFDYVVSRGGVDLAVGAARVTVTALAHASIAGVMGYYLGQARFEHKPAWYLPSGLVAVALLNGLFFFGQDMVTLRGLTFNPYYGLGAAAVVALILLGTVMALTRRANLETLSLAALPPAADTATVMPRTQAGGGE